MTACNARREQEWKDRIAHAWHVGALVRQRNAKKFPSLHELLPSKVTTPPVRRAQTPEEMLAVMRAWVIRTGG